MILSQLARALRLPFAAKPPLASSAESSPDLKWFESALGDTLPAVLGCTPEAANHAAIIQHCAEIAKAVGGRSEIAPGELIATMLGYFMMQTLPPPTRGLFYCGEAHPLSRLAQENGCMVVSDARSANANLGPPENTFSSAIVILQSRTVEFEFSDHVLPRLAGRMAAMGVEVLVSAQSPERAANVANAIFPRPDYRTMNFPAVESRLGLIGISLRCV